MINKIRLWGGGNYVYCDTLQITFSRERPVVSYQNSIFSEGVFLGKYQIEECTDLMTRGGTDIYEGDILEYPDGELSFTAVVKRDRHTFYLEGIDTGDNYDFDDIRDDNVLDVKILGNIRKNPELLKPKEEA